MLMARSIAARVLRGLKSGVSTSEVQVCRSIMMLLVLTLYCRRSLPFRLIRSLWNTPTTLSLLRGCLLAKYIRTQPDRSLAGSALMVPVCAIDHSYEHSVNSVQALARFCDPNLWLPSRDILPNSTKLFCMRAIAISTCAPKRFHLLPLVPSLILSLATLCRRCISTTCSVKTVLSSSDPSFFICVSLSRFTVQISLVCCGLMSTFPVMRTRTRHLCCTTLGQRRITLHLASYTSLPSLVHSL